MQKMSHCFFLTVHEKPLEKHTLFEALSPPTFPADRLNPVVSLAALRAPIALSEFSLLRSPLLEMGSVQTVSREDPQPPHEKKGAKAVHGFPQITSLFHQ